MVRRLGPATVEKNANNNTELGDDLKTKVAWLYYMEGKTQEDISKAYGLSRSKVLRSLASSRQDGTVQISIATNLSRCVELERSLENLIGLERAIVIPYCENPETEYVNLGVALAKYVN